MLVELHVSLDASQTIRKRWFQDDYFDLFIWQDPTNIISFQLCYDRMGRERVVSWDEDRGFGHHSIDDGESSPHKNMTPVFVMDGAFCSDEVLPKFTEAYPFLPQDIADFVLQKLIEYAEKLCPS